MHSAWSRKCGADGLKMVVEGLLPLVTINSMLIRCENDRIETMVYVELVLIYDIFSLEV
jgi:hypothetical protein